MTMAFEEIDPVRSMLVRDSPSKIDMSRNNESPTFPASSSSNLSSQPTPPASPPSADVASSPAWEISRHGDLERKRMEIVRKRANLERRLFASKSGIISEPPDPESEATRSCGDVANAADFRASGRGKFEFKDGSSVTGSWFLGQLDGRCFFQWPTAGDTYDGDTMQGMKHGRGVQTWADGKIYKGEFTENSIHGFGTLTQADGVTRYRGSFHQGKRHGLGTQIWRDKTYEGEWQDNAVCGNGRLSWEDGTRYEGAFLQGRYHGQGSLVNGSSGRKYAGSWVKGLKEGHGQEVWPDVGQTYVGAFKANKRHGFGRLTMGDGSTYVGGWSDGERAGYGIHLTSNGDVLHCGEMFQMTRTLSFSDLQPSATGASQRQVHSDDLNVSLQKHSQLSWEMSEEKRHQDDTHLGGFVSKHVYGK